MTNSTVLKSFCTTREAADLLGVSIGTIQLWVESGLLKGWKTAGGHRRVLRTSVDGLLYREGVPQDGDKSSPTSQIGEEPDVEESLKVMVVEDDAALLRLYEIRMSAWQIPLEMQLVRNAFNALMLIGADRPDLLITDLNMPGTDGFALLRALAQSPESRDIPIIVVTGLDVSEIAARGGVPAGVEVLGKPVPFERIRQRAIELNRRKHSKSNLYA